MVEAIIIQFLLVMPLAYLLFSDIGLNQFQIGLTQATFSFVMIFLEIPTGYFADRISRRVSNALGDIGITLAMILYFFANSFIDVIVVEIIFGIGLSLSSGADLALLKVYCEKTKVEYSQVIKNLQSYKFVSSGVAAIAGGVIGAWSLRGAFLVQAGLFALAAILALFVKDIGEKRTSEKHPIKDMVEVVKYCVHGHKELAKRILLSACLMSSTYFIVWFTTPMLLKASIPISYQGLYFALALVFATIGSAKFAKSKTISLTLPLLLVTISYLVLGFKVNFFTILLYFVIGFCRGINTARINPYMQEIAPNDIQATVTSVYSVVYRVFSATLMLLTTYFGNIKFQFGFLAAAAICALFWVVFRRNNRPSSFYS